MRCSAPGGRAPHVLCLNALFGCTRLRCLQPSGHPGRGDRLVKVKRLAGTCRVPTVVHSAPLHRAAMIESGEASRPTTRRAGSLPEELGSASVSYTHLTLPTILLV